MPPGRPRGSTNLKKMSKASKKYDIRRNPKRLALGHYNFTRYSGATVGTTNNFTTLPANTQEPWNFTFSLGQVRNATDFSNLFDMYQITKIDVYFKLANNPCSSANTSIASQYYPVLWYVRDYDDGGNLTVAQMQEKQGSKRLVLKPDTIYKVSVTPKFQKMVYQTLTSTGYGPGQGWLDCVDSTVPHFGLKTVFNTPATGEAWTVDVQAKYHLSFRGPQ